MKLASKLNHIYFCSADKDIKNKDGVEGDQNDSSASKEGDDSWLSINGLFERFGRLRLSKGADKKLLVYRPKVLTEVWLIWNYSDLV